MRTLLAAKKAYEQDDGKDPIRRLDYITFLDAFESLVVRLQLTDSYETDFRRNLPAGGWRGLQSAARLQDRISDVREFLKIHPVYSAAGASLLTNIIACIELCVRQDINPEKVLSDLESTLIRVGHGDLRQEKF
ncbi:hypothetical protein [Paraburkholderia tropica]|uniref:hypothetical protein n=1 Tax=Paraburkholderia tropica TaxID=92647 RepID=UPI002AB715C6|nr:hypothetical protein [Paraburkholderia tropica]